MPFGRFDESDAYKSLEELYGNMTLEDLETMDLSDTNAPAPSNDDDGSDDKGGSPASPAPAPQEGAFRHTPSPGPMCGNMPGAEGNADTDASSAESPAPTPTPTPRPNADAGIPGAPPVNPAERSEDVQGAMRRAAEALATPPVTLPGMAATAAPNVVTAADVEIPDMDPVPEMNQAPIPEIPAEIPQGKFERKHPRPVIENDTIVPQAEQSPSDSATSAQETIPTRQPQPQAQQAEQAQPQPQQADRTQSQPQAQQTEQVPTQAQAQEAGSIPTRHTQTQQTPQTEQPQRTQQPQQPQAQQSEQTQQQQQQQPPSQPHRTPRRRHTQVTGQPRQEQTQSSIAANATPQCDGAAPQTQQPLVGTPSRQPHRQSSKQPRGSQTNDTKNNAKAQGTSPDDNRRMSTMSQDNVIDPFADFDEELEQAPSNGSAPVDPFGDDIFAFAEETANAAPMKEATAPAPTSDEDDLILNELLSQGDDAMEEQSYAELDEMISRASGKVDSDEFTDALIQIAREACYITRRYAQKDYEIEIISQGNFVTEVDHVVEEFLKDKLSALLPGSGFISEESKNSVSKDGGNWVIDPIDGTSNYMHGLFYAVSIALLQGGQTTIGCVIACTTDVVFFGRKGQGAFKEYLDGTRIALEISEFQEKEGLLFFGCPYDRDKGAMIFYRCAKLYPYFSDVKRLGPAALDILQLTNGVSKLYIEFDLQAWDIAAGMLILKESGGSCELTTDNMFLFGTKEAIAQAVDVLSLELKH